jgi:hypothetical protein
MPPSLLNKSRLHASLQVFEDLENTAAPEDAWASRTPGLAKAQSVRAVEVSWGLMIDTTIIRSPLGLPFTILATPTGQR